jgi:hypothetical protein
MGLFAIIEDDVVINTIVGESLEEVKELYPKLLCVEYTYESPAAIGYLYDGLVFRNPSVVDAVSEEPTEDPA